MCVYEHTQSGVQSSPSPAPPSVMPYQPQPAKVNISTVPLLFTNLSLQEGVDKLAYYQGQVQELTKLLNVCVRMCACVCVFVYVDTGATFIQCFTAV